MLQCSSWENSLFHTFSMVIVNVTMSLCQSDNQRVGAMTGRCRISSQVSVSQCLPGRNASERVLLWWHIMAYDDFSNFIMVSHDSSWFLQKLTLGPFKGYWSSLEFQKRLPPSHRILFSAVRATFLDPERRGSSHGMCWRTAMGRIPAQDPAPRVADVATGGTDWGWSVTDRWCRMWDDVNLHHDVSDFLMGCIFGIKFTAGFTTWVFTNYIQIIL